MRMACKPFVGAIRAPSNSKNLDLQEQSKAPDVELEPNFVFGFRVKDMRNNIRYLKNGSLVYTAAALGVIFNVKENKQTFFKEHSDDITAFDMNPDGVRVATGQQGRYPAIYVWDANTLKVKNVFQGDLQRGIEVVSFSPSGDKLIGTGKDDDHCIVIYDLTNVKKEGGFQLVDQKGGREVLIDIQWQNEEQFVTVGPQHFQLWDLHPEKNNQIILDFKRGSYGKFFSQCSDSLLTVAMNGSQIVCGALDGTLQIFQEHQLKTYKSLHSLSLQAITIKDDIIYTGGNDGKVNILDKLYNIILVIDELTFKDSLCPKIRSIAVSANNRQLMVGTYGSEIFQLNTKDQVIGSNTVFVPQPIMYGHYTPNQQDTNEVWGLCTFPGNPDLFVTVSDDATMRIWNKKEKKMVKWASINVDSKGNTVAPDSSTNDLRISSKARCVAVNNDASLFVVGARDGTVRVFNGSLKLVKYFRHAKEEISDIQFSPDGETLAIGSHDNAIYIYNINDFQLKHNPLNQHSSYITHFDFSRDGKSMHSTCGAYELMFWDLVKGKQDTRGATKFKDEFWATWNVPIGWPVQGIFQKGEDGTDINAVDRSHRPVSHQAPNNYHLVAAGDDFGKLCVYRYPSVKQHSNGVQGRGHSSHVTNVQFSADDRKIFTTGGEDQCVIQWNVIQKLPEPGPAKPQPQMVQRDNKFFFH